MTGKISSASETGNQDLGPADNKSSLDCLTNKKKMAVEHEDLSAGDILFHSWNLLAAHKEIVNESAASRFQMSERMS